MSSELLRSCSTRDRTTLGRVGANRRTDALGRRRTCGRALRLGLIGSLLVVFSAPNRANADAVSSKRREAAKIAASIESLGDRLSALAEDENEAQLRLAKLKARVRSSERDLAAADAKSVTLELRANRAALIAVTDPFASAGIAIDGAAAIDEFERSAVLTDRARDFDRNAIDALRAWREDIERKRQVVTGARRDTENLAAMLAKKRLDADRLLSRYEVLERRANGELKTLVAQAEKARIAEEARRSRLAIVKQQEQARRELAARQASLARSSSASRAAAIKKKAEADKRLAALGRKGSGATRQDIAAAREAAVEAASGSSAPTRGSAARELARLEIAAGSDSGLPPAPGGSSAVDAALNQLGKPYIWGASGPGGFDCSGLMLSAWRAAGRSLPHSSRAQYAATTRVSVSQIRAGDLVFYGSPIHHVGMYIGNGEMVEASRRGTPVRTRSIFRRDLVGVGRVG